MARYVNCKKGLHMYSPLRNVGGGIARRSCSVCGSVQIDIGEVSEGGATDLFTEPKLASMFEVEALLATVVEPVSTGRSFGEAPMMRRRPARAAG